MTHLAPIRTLLLVALALAAAVAGCGDSPMERRTPRDLKFETEDGAEIAATLYPAGAPDESSTQPPGLILIHGLGGQRSQCDVFARRAQDAGFQSLAIDMRAHGDSTAGEDQPSRRQDFGREDWLRVTKDIQAAKETLIEHGSAPDNLGLVGASLGGTLALRYAVEDWDFHALVMVSPGLDYQGIEAEEALVEYGNRPSLFVTSRGDSYSATSAQQLKRAAPGQAEIREYRGTAHGTDLLETSPQAVQQVLLWLSQIIGDEAVELPDRVPAGDAV
ncbi:MAG: alpha/beta hydrolase [Candidatus Hydrogenedentota bacterium]